MVYDVVMIEPSEVSEQATESVFSPARPDFADFDTADDRDSFHWGAILDHWGVETGESIALYVFRSISRSDADKNDLEKLDKAALGVAEEAPGFYGYKPFDGVSFCGWMQSTDAEAATKSKEHRNAASHASEVYEKYRITSWRVTKLAVDGEVDLEKVYEHQWPPQKTAA